MSKSGSLLSWHGGFIPSNEVWVKVGGDHGGDSFKVILQIANLLKLNSKQYFSTLHCQLQRQPAESQNSATSIQRADIQNALNGMEGKNITCLPLWRLQFSPETVQIVGAQAVHPCLWCTAAKKQLQKAPHEQPHISSRMLQNIKRDYHRFSRAGHGKKYAKGYNNAVH